MLIKRQILSEVKLLATQFRALSIIGPRQSGKTTLCQLAFGNKPYVNFENPATEAEALTDVAGFLKKFPDGAILDEVQRVPDIFRRLQVILDQSNKRGHFILTGSNNFLLQEHISQSLAGRIGYLQLLPLSYAELKSNGLASNNIHKHILTGGYPEIWNLGLQADKWMQAYIQTYVQRDVRLLRNITNLGNFNRFVILCANYAGQLLNRDELAKSIGVDTKTIQAWLGVLESSYIIYLLQPWYNNLNKRIIKSPKLYFYDTGLLCNLLGIRTQSTLEHHEKYGAIFENWVITEIKKNRFNSGDNSMLYFFRDSAGNEMDLVLEKNEKMIGIEIKSAKKISPHVTPSFRYWKKNNPTAENILIYSGNATRELASATQLLSWRDIDEL
ncbi:MAG TPA: ATP-binding protein [Chitinophagaceae bacterium]|nr:ATP-binding protein [Chitinophagaceae bacterium]